MRDDLKQLMTIGMTKYNRECNFFCCCLLFYKLRYVKHKYIYTKIVFLQRNVSHILIIIIYIIIFIVMYIFILYRIGADAKFAYFLIYSVNALPTCRRCCSDFNRFCFSFPENSILHHISNEP